jgi:hypothetical protein
LWSELAQEAQITVGFLRHSDTEPQAPWCLKWHRGRWEGETP